MRQILFNNNQTVPGATAYGSLVEGRVYVFDADNMATSLAMNVATTAKEVIFVQGGKNGKHIMSAPIKVADVKSVGNNTYVAPVPQITTLTPNFTTTVPAGEGTVRLVRSDSGFRPNERITATVTFTGKTREAIVDEFVTLINKAHPKFVTASRSGAGDTSALVLTANSRMAFNTSTEDLAGDFTIAATQAANFGSGTYADVSELEEIAWGANVLNRIYLPVFAERYAQSGTNYDMYQFEFKTTTTPNIAKSNEYGLVTIAVATGGVTPGIDLATFFGA